MLPRCWSFASRPCAAHVAPSKPAILATCHADEYTSDDEWLTSQYDKIQNETYASCCYVALCNFFAVSSLHFAFAFAAALLFAFAAALLFAFATALLFAFAAALLFPFLFFAFATALLFAFATALLFAFAALLFAFAATLLFAFAAALLFAFATALRAEGLFTTFSWLDRLQLRKKDIGTNQLLISKAKCLSC